MGSSLDEMISYRDEMNLPFLNFIYFWQNQIQT